MDKGAIAVMPTGLIALEAVRQINRVDADVQAAAREHGITESEITPQQLIRIARGLQFKTKAKPYRAGQLNSRYPLPAIVPLQSNGYIVLLKNDHANKAALCFLPREKATKSFSFDELDSLSNGSVIILKHKLEKGKSLAGFRWFYAPITKFYKIIAEVMACSAVVQLFGLAGPIFTQVILDQVIVHRSLPTLDILAIAYIFITVFEFLLNVVRNYIFMHTATKIDAILGSALFKHLFALPFVYFESRRVGVTVARVKELDNIREFITSKSVSVIIDLLFSLVFLVFMFLYSVPLTFVVLAFVAVVSILYIVVTPELRNRLQDKFQMAAQSQSYLVEAITGIRTVKSLAIEGVMHRKWETALGDYLRSSFKLSAIGNVAGSFSNMCQKAMTIAVLYLGVCMVIENKMTIGMLIAFQMYANQFTTPVLRLVNLWNEFQQTLLAVDRLDDILQHPIEIQTSKPIAQSNLRGDIAFENVSFKYTADGPLVLKGVNFTVPPGSSIGIVGKTGSGKSTIASVIQRLYLTHEGAIFIDGTDIRELDPFWLRRNMGIVPQETYLFSGTIRDNISMPRPDASIEQIIAAAQTAGAHDFITRLPKGYETQVGERGSTLSGGQKQRIAIARALITDPRILIFDEATSALDYESERIIQENLNNIKADRTFVVIAHRLSTVKDCTKIIVIDNGEIIESGSHRELISLKGAYHNLYQQQVSMNALTPV